MPTIIDGTNGVDKLAAGAIEYADLPAGSVLQVIQGSTSTNTSTSSSSYVDTNLTATITPKYATSKILVLVNQAECFKPNNTASGAIGFQLVRNSTVLTDFGKFLLYLAGTAASMSSNEGCIYLDSPATTSATTYKTQFAAQNGVSNVLVQGDSSTSTITLMEIAA